MTGLTSSMKGNVFEQRSKAVPAWFRFCGLAVLGIFFLIVLLISVRLLNGNTTGSLTFSQSALENPLWVLLALWGLFALYAVSFYGLLKGLYPGLIACLLLVYASMANSVYVLLTTGRMDLTLIAYLVVVYQLHKVLRHWLWIKPDAS